MPTIPIQSVIDRLDVAAKNHPLKALEIKHTTPDGDIAVKAESTLRAELNGQRGYKVGLSTALQIIEQTGDLSALDIVEESLGRVAFPIPKADACHGRTTVGMMQLVGSMSKEFGEAVGAMSKAMSPDSDGGEKFTTRERVRCIKEIRDLVKVLVETEAHLCVEPI